jgi:ApaG protein
MRCASEACTRGIRVRVESYYVPERSSPALSCYYFAYRVRISNESATCARLVSRHWIITDGNGIEQHVTGAGVVGEQPRIEPGETYEYTSACPLPTPTGFMRGSYEMEREGGGTFEAEIAEFPLVTPGLSN